ncbi:hypothetical protein [Levilactobacillus spicheri]|uniref:hypothetical protein n=1 Tax=Levilactobacillus spicheri TaxID=216463 RepID=UPI000AB9B190|nr:hypothetical protein [Levilactobacillus spicheri]
MIDDTSGWLTTLSWGILLTFGGALVILAGCWWHILRTTIRQFNVEGPADD